MGETIHATLNSITALVSLLGVLWLAAVKITRLEVKTDTMWSMLLKRAVVEGVHLGHMEVHSPVRLVNDSANMLAALAPELAAFYESSCKGMSDNEAALAIERQFGTRLATEICIPNNISFGVCLLIALAVAKQTDTLTEILDHHLPKGTAEEARA